MPPNDTKQRKRDDHEELEQSLLSSSSSSIAERRRKSQQQQRTTSRSSSTIDAYIPNYLRHLVHAHQGDYCYTSCFHPDLIGQLMMEGFLPIACSDTICLPKLHEYRCIIHPLVSNLHIANSTRKKSKRFRLTINQSFDRVVRECHRQHGQSCWLYPQLVQAFAALHKNAYLAKSSSLSAVNGNTKIIPVRVHSIEVWDEATGELAAGELGYTVGALYTSLTGFTIQDSAGSVQLVALGRLLQQCGFAVWDFGMTMTYKTSLGCQDVPRTAFLQLLHEHRTVDTALSFASPDIREKNCRVLIDQEPTATTTTTRVHL